MSLDTRAAAAQVLARVAAGSSLNRILPDALERVSERDRALLQQLCYGTLRLYPRLLGLLQPLLAKPLRSKDADIRALLLVGLYQLEASRVPDHAAVAASVAATRALSKPWASGLTNAVLRRFLREREQLYAKLDTAAATAHPLWLYRRLEQEWPGELAALLRANNQQPPMTLRVHAGVTNSERYLTVLKEQSIEAHPGTLGEHAIYLHQPRDVADVPGFERGEVSVQDEAAQLAAPLLAARPGERILDACAAPGGKTCHILESQPDLFELVAMDVDPERLRKVDQNLVRLGLTATLLTGDAARPPAELERASFDAILVDAPCSATGVIRRHPDIKLLRRELDIDHLADLQLAILTGLWPLLKPGGRLLYATCSVLRQENSSVVQSFLTQTDDARAVALPGEGGDARGPGRQLLPQDAGPDGLYYALLRKSA